MFNFEISDVCFILQGLLYLLRAALAPIYIILHHLIVYQLCSGSKAMTSGEYGLNMKDGARGRHPWRTCAVYSSWLFLPGVFLSEPGGEGASSLSFNASLYSGNCLSCYRSLVPPQRPSPWGDVAGEPQRWGLVLPPPPVSVGTIHKVRGSGHPSRPWDPLPFRSSPIHLFEHPHFYTEGSGRPQRAILGTSSSLFPCTMPRWRRITELRKVESPCRDSSSPDPSLSSCSLSSHRTLQNAPHTLTSRHPPFPSLRT